MNHFICLWLNNTSSTFHTKPRIVLSFCRSVMAAAETCNLYRTSTHLNKNETTNRELWHSPFSLFITANWDYRNKDICLKIQTMTHVRIMISNRTNSISSYSMVGSAGRKNLHSSIVELSHNRKFVFSNTYFPPITSRFEEYRSKFTEF